MKLASILLFRLANPIKAEESMHITSVCQSAYAVTKPSFLVARGRRKGMRACSTTKGFFRVLFSMVCKVLISSDQKGTFNEN